MGQQNLYENCIVKIYTQRARGGSERERERYGDKIDRQREKDTERQR